MLDHAVKTNVLIHMYFMSCKYAVTDRGSYCSESSKRIKREHSTQKELLKRTQEALWSRPPDAVPEGGDNLNCRLQQHKDYDYRSN
jgi:hypothetical protein